MSQRKLATPTERCNRLGKQEFDVRRSREVPDFLYDNSGDDECIELDDRVCSNFLDVAQQEEDAEEEMVIIKNLELEYSSDSMESLKKDQIENDFKYDTEEDDEEIRTIAIGRNRWRIQEVPKDGNCLFSSLAVSCGKSANHHAVFRTLAVQSVLENCWTENVTEIKQRYFSKQELLWLKQHNCGTAEDDLLKMEYYKKMNRLGVYGTEIEYIAAEKVLPIKLGIIQENQINPATGKPVNKDQRRYTVTKIGTDEGKARKWILFTGCFQSGHYEPLVLIGHFGQDEEELQDGQWDDAYTSASSAVIEGNNNSETEDEENEEEKKYVEQVTTSTTVQIEDKQLEVVQDVPKDGNSLFATLAYLCDLPISMHGFMRRKIVTAAVSEKYWKGISGRVRSKHFRNQSQSLLSDADMKERYMAKMKTNLQYGSSIELTIASQVLPIEISCTKQDPSSSQNEYVTCHFHSKTIPQREEEEEEEKERKWILYSKINDDDGREYFQPLEEVVVATVTTSSTIDDAEEESSQTELFSDKNCDPLPFICASMDCSFEGFSSIQLYREHLHDHHKRPFPQQQGDKSNKEEQEYVYKCPIDECTVQFVDLFALMKHMINCHSKENDESNDD